MFSKNFVAGFVVAIGIVLVWLYGASLWNTLAPYTFWFGTSESSTADEQSQDVGSLDSQDEPTPSTEPDAVGIPAKELPITDTQKQMAENFGIDTDAFVITPAMQACAKEKLGAQRYEQILAGSSPGPLEVVQLGVCISSTPQQ